MVLRECVVRYQSVFACMAVEDSDEGWVILRCIGMSMGSMVDNYNYNIRITFTLQENALAIGQIFESAV